MEQKNNLVSQILMWIVIIILVVFGGIKILQNKTSNQTGTINIGFVGPLSGDGAAWGDIEKNTIALAVDEINNAGGIKGRQIHVTYEDGKCTGKDGLSAAKKLVEIDGIKILLVSCSQEMLPIAPYAESSKVIAWTSYASASGISSAGQYIFRNSWTNKDMAKSMSGVAIKYGKSVAIIGELSEFASDLRDLFIKEFKQAGGIVVDQEDFQQGEKDFRSQVSKMIAKKPSVIMVNPNSPSAGIAALKQIRELGYKGQIVGNFFGGSKEVQALPEAQGMIYISDPVLALSPLKQKVFDMYKAKYGVTPDLEWPVGSRYDAVYILKQAIEAVGDDPTALKDYLHNMPTDFTGILGTYRFEKDSADITNVKPSVAQIKDYKTVPYII
jgi:branched-chain amino acid transport system substrate-binding protein